MRVRRTAIFHLVSRSAGPALLVVAAVLLLQSCDGSGAFFAVSGPGHRAWVADEPIQCLQNPWELDWRNQPGNDTAAYPTDPASQNAILIDYYSKQGVRVHDIVSIPRYPVTCKACTCPRGDTLYLLVDQEDTREMVTFGYRLEEPRWFGPGGP